MTLATFTKRESPALDRMVDRGLLLDAMEWSDSNGTASRPRAQRLFAHAVLLAGSSPFTKVCSRCGETKRLDEFYSQGPARPTPRADCKLCFKKSRVARRTGLGEVSGPLGDVFGNVTTGGI